MRLQEFKNPRHDWLIVEATQDGKNTHLEHAEDLVFLQGKQGAETAVNYIDGVREMLAQGGSSKSKVTVKWDGCVHEDTIVLTNLGDMTIKEVVDRCQWDDTLMVMGRNMTPTQEYNHMVNIIAGMYENADKDWVEIELVDGTTYKMTADHQVHTSNRGWVEAGLLTEEDDITEL